MVNRSYGPRPVVAVGAVLLTVVIVVGYRKQHSRHRDRNGHRCPWNGCSWVPCNTTVVRWFVVRRGFATTIATAGKSCQHFGSADCRCPCISVWMASRDSGYVPNGRNLYVAELGVLERDPERVGQQADGRIVATAGSMKISKKNDAR